MRVSPKTRSPEDRHEAILETAHRLFSERGVNGTLLEDVARTARVSKGSLYEVAEDKQDLFYQVCRRQFDSDLDNLERISAKISDPEKLLRRFIKLLLPPSREAPGAYAIIFELVSLSLRDPVFGTKVTDLHTEMRDRLRGLIVRVLREGVTRDQFHSDLDCETVAMVVHSWIDKCWVDWAMIPSMTRAHVLDQAKRFTHFLLTAIRVP